MKLIEVATAAKKLTVSERTIYRMINDPLCPLKAVRIYRGGIRVIYDSLEKCMEPIGKKSCQSMTAYDNSAKCDTPH